MAQRDDETLDPRALGSFLAALADPVVAVARGAIVAGFNTEASATFPALTTGAPLALAIRNPMVLDAVAQVLAGGTASEFEMAGRVTADGAFAVRVAPLRGLGALVMVRDLTQMRRIERMRVDFVANASHELRTPLAALVGAAETLAGPARDDAAARDRFLAMMREQADRMRRLVDDLLSLSRIEAKGLLPPTGTVDLAHLARAAADTLAPLARERGATLVVAAPETPLRVPGDPDEMARLIENLLENAIRHGRRNGEVTVAVTDAGERGAAIAVSDDGPGIAAEHIPRLTERFYRAAPDGAVRGTGLGLAIVKHIVQRHRGRLEIDSVPGHGATFRVRLPRGA